MGWDLFDDSCIKISAVTTSLTDIDLGVCESGSDWYNNSLVPYWMQVKKSNCLNRNYILTFF